MSDLVQQPRKGVAFLARHAGAVGGQIVFAILFSSHYSSNRTGFVNFADFPCVMLIVKAVIVLLILRERTPMTTICIQNRKLLRHRILYDFFILARAQSRQDAYMGV